MRSFFTLACLSLLGAFSAQAYIYSTNFNSGNIPRTITVENANGTQISSSYYRYGYTENGWIAEQVNDAGYAAVCPSHTAGSSDPLDSRLSLPALTITGEAPMLRWNALSIYGYVPESYQVSVNDGESTTVIFSIDEEKDVWTTRAADLSPWIGKEVTITFTCNSVDRYMLAIDDILVGDAEDTLFRVDTADTPLLPLGTGSTTLSGTITNLGQDASFTSLALYADGEKIDEMPLSTPLKGCASTDYEFTLPLTLNTLVEYTIKGIGGDEQVTLHTGKAYATNYERNLILDKGTGMWCNNCPDGTLVLESLQRIYGDNLIPLAIHARPDMYACEDYWSYLKWYSVPRLMMNRDKTTENDASASKVAMLDPQIFLPTDFCIYISDASFTDDELTVTASVKHAEGLDNAGDRYRIGYTLLTDVIAEGFDPTIYQSNNAGSLKKLQYYYLPTRIPSDLAPMEHIVLTGGEEAFTGIPQSMAVDLKAKEAVSHTWTINRPELLDLWTKGKLVAYVVDSSTGILLNSTIFDINDPIVIDPEPVDPEPVDPDPVDPDPVDPDPVDPDPIDPDPVDPDPVDPTPVDPDPVDPEPGYISSINAENAPAEYFTIYGVRVTNPDKGMYIMRQGNKVTKVFF